ncbi:hypothetical protein B0H11DRAFT_1902455 [Mycena galericulata]|nr:hypothetical protein B0H11DRAFT_1902455 [Mycena galericulata]
MATGLACPSREGFPDAGGWWVWKHIGCSRRRRSTIGIQICGICGEQGVAFRRQWGWKRIRVLWGGWHSFRGVIRDAGDVAGLSATIDDCRRFYRVKTRLEFSQWVPWGLRGSQKRDMKETSGKHKGLHGERQDTKETSASQGQSQVNTNSEEPVAAANVGQPLSGPRRPEEPGMWRQIQYHMIKGSMPWLITTCLPACTFAVAHNIPISHGHGWPVPLTADSIAVIPTKLDLGKKMSAMRLRRCYRSSQISIHTVVQHFEGPWLLNARSQRISLEGSAERKPGCHGRDAVPQLRDLGMQQNGELPFKVMHCPGSPAHNPHGGLHWLGTWKGLAGDGIKFTRLGRKGLCGAKYNLGTRGSRSIRLISHVNGTTCVRLKVNEENMQCGCLGLPRGVTVPLLEPTAELVEFHLELMFHYGTHGGVSGVSTVRLPLNYHIWQWIIPTTSLGPGPVLGTGTGKPGGFAGRVRRVRVAGQPFSKPETRGYLAGTGENRHRV